MRIIGHRGAAGLALENSKASFIAAIDHGADMIELDTRLTADNHLVVIHNATTATLSDSTLSVHKETLAKLQTLQLTNGEHLLSLDEALTIIGSTPVIIELKDTGCVDELLLVLERHPDSTCYISSFNHDELRRVRRTFPKLPIFVLEHFGPTDIIHSAHNLHANGIGLNKWLMNPLTYRLAKHYNLELHLYTVNSPLMARILQKVYPGISIHTDHPERFTGK